MEQGQWRLQRGENRLAHAKHQRKCIVLHERNSSSSSRGRSRNESGSRSTAFLLYRVCVLHIFSIRWTARLSVTDADAWLLYRQHHMHRHAPCAGVHRLSSGVPGLSQSDSGGAPNLYAGSPLYRERTNVRIFQRSSEFLIMAPNGGIGPTTFSRPLRL